MSLKGLWKQRNRGSQIWRAMPWTCSWALWMLIAHCDCAQYFCSRLLCLSIVFALYPVLDFAQVPLTDENFIMFSKRYWETKSHLKRQKVLLKYVLKENHPVVIYNILYRPDPISWCPAGGATAPLHSGGQANKLVKSTTTKNIKNKVQAQFAHAESINPVLHNCVLLFSIKRHFLILCLFSGEILKR